LVVSEEKRKRQGCGMAEDALSAGVRSLFALLPRQSALRRPLCRVLLDGLSADELGDLKLPLKVATIKRYRNEEVDMEPLLVKRSRVVGMVNVPFSDHTKVAKEWIVAECGVTQSGRTREVFKTELSFNQLFLRYQREVADEKQVSVNIFARLSKQHHVHFGVGAVDTMTCVNCRDWVVRLEELEEEMQLNNSDRRKKSLQQQHEELCDKLHHHQDALVRQRHAWRSDLEEVRKNKQLTLCVLDFSTFELMDRKSASVFCVVVTFNENGELVRRYYDFVDVHLPGRKRDVVFFALTLLYRRKVFAEGQHVRLWSDAGSSDFRNAPCLYSCLQLNGVCTGVVFEGFSFFGARHGWNDCDRHFGTGKQSMSRWLVEEASCNKALTLDVGKCAEILAGLHNTTALVCTRAEIAGADHPPVKNLTKHYCFRFISPNTLLQAMFSDEREGVLRLFPSGEMLPAKIAKESARARKKSKK
jgi:hypothetical protein